MNEKKQALELIDQLTNAIYKLELLPVGAQMSRSSNLTDLAERLSQQADRVHLAAKWHKD